MFILVYTFHSTWTWNVKESPRCPDIPYPTTVPDNARTKEAIKLSGVIHYDFNDDKPNGPDFTPVWKKFKHSLPEDLGDEKNFSNGHI